MAFKFEELHVWKLAQEQSFRIHEIRRSFPPEERYVLADQIQRAADSVALNIAEGSTGQSDPEFKKFLGYAIRSAVEVAACLHLARKRSLVDQGVFETNYTSCEHLVVLLQRLRKSL